MDDWGFADLEAQIKTWNDIHYPSDAEQARLLDMAFLRLEHLVSRGMRERTIKPLYIKWLAKNASTLGQNEEAIRRSFNRYLDRWRNGGRKLSAIFDKRPRGAMLRTTPMLSQAEQDRIVACAVYKCKGTLDRAWRLEWPNLSQEVRERYPVPAQRRTKHWVPAKIRRQLQPEIDRIMAEHVGPRNARLNGSYKSRNWSRVFAGDWFSADDVTLPVYYYEPEQPYEVLRGQFIPMIDVKSNRVLDFCMIPDAAYDASSIRRLISRVCRRFGIPRKGFMFECGIWKKAKLLGGPTKNNPYADTVETFVDRLGIRISHAKPGNARSKIIERINGILQDYMGGEPGYVGRDEKNIKYERVVDLIKDVKARRKTAAEAGFYSLDEWVARIKEICEDYNSNPRNSRVMGGFMSPDEAWYERQPTNAEGQVVGLSKLPAEMDHLLAAHRQPAKVTRHGISILNGKYRYLSEVTGALQGQTVIVWHDPDHTEMITVTDLNGRNPKCVPRLYDASADDGFKDGSAQAAQSLVSAHNGYRRIRYSQIKANYIPPARPVVTDVESLEKAREMHEQRQRFELEERTRNTVKAEEVMEPEWRRFLRAAGGAKAPGI